MWKTYKITSVDYCEDLGICCENCGRPIKNIATVENNIGVCFNVGLDCAETLESQEISNYWEFQQQKKEYKHLLTRISRIRKETKLWNLIEVRSGNSIWKNNEVIGIYYVLEFKSNLEIWSWNIYPSYRKQFWEIIEKTYNNIIIRK